MNKLIKNGFSQTLVLLLMFFLALSLPLATNLVKQSQDDRSRATDTSTSQVSFKIAFAGVKPSSTCLTSLNKVKVEVANKPTNTFQSDINALLTPVSNETNKDGDQVFLVSNLVLDSKFNNVNNFNYIRVKGPSHLTSRMCLNNQDTKLDELSTCEVNLKNTNTTTYDFADYSLIPGDINQDGVVNSADYSVIKNNFNNQEISCGISGDLNYDGIVNSLDANLLKDTLSEKEDGQIINSNPITNTPTTTIKPTNTPVPIKTLTPTPTPTQGQVKVGLKFAVMADIHNNTSGLKKMINRAKNDGMDIVFIAGDLTKDGKRDELTTIKKVLDASGVRYEATEGNHDMRQSLFDNVFGESFQSIRFDGVKFILIDNSDYRGLDGGVLKGKGQKAWIEKEVAECKTIICIGIMHMPLNHPTSDHLMGEFNKDTAKEAVWLRKLLVDSGVKEIETGHIHHFATYTIGGLKTNQVGSGSSSDFSEFTIDGSGKITRAKITL